MSAFEQDVERIHHHTKILATLGPATSSPEMLEELFALGLNAVRMNFSHGDSAFHQENARRVRAASENVGRQVAIVADLQGPKIRVGKMAGGGVNIKEGDALILDPDYHEDGTAERVGLDYEALPRDVTGGDILLLDDGLIRLKVVKVAGNEVHTKVLTTAVLKSNKGINKQGGGLSAAALTDKDRRDLKTAVELGADYLAVSFVKSADDMNLARHLVAQAVGDENKVAPGLIAKIERIEAIEHLEEIIEASDGIMVARGDLAVEVGNAAVPALQKRMIKSARRLRRFTITATQMMESMISNPVPTRAEVSDVANAVLDGTDAVMLSAESAIGKYPYETVRYMAEVCRAAEQSEEPMAAIDMAVSTTGRIDQTIASGAVYTASKIGAKAIVALTQSGTTAFQISRYGINVPIYALTSSVRVQRRMTLYRGVRPLLLDVSKDHDEACREVEEDLLTRGIVKKDDVYVLTSGATIGEKGSTNTLQILRA